MKWLKRIGLMLAVLVAAPVTAASAQSGVPPSIWLIVEDGPEGCTLKINNRSTNFDQLEQQARTWKAEGSAAGIIFERTSVRCISAAIVQLERGGISYIHFTQGGAREVVQVGVPAGVCGVTIDGRAASLPDLSNRAASWARTQPLIDLQLGAGVRGECVSQVISILKNTNPTGIRLDLLRIGFVNTKPVQRSSGQ